LIVTLSAAVENSSRFFKLKVFRHRLALAILVRSWFDSATPQRADQIIDGRQQAQRTRTARPGQDRRTPAMQCFFVEFQCKLGEAYTVADEIANREIASEIYSVSGQFDLLAKFYIDDDVDIGRFVAENIHTVPGVERTHTILTFKAF
jgi:DNA-binding Lrp family transcriptional regulator